MKKESRMKRFFGKMRYKYRLIVMNESTYEERFAMRLSRLNVFTVISLSILSMIVLAFILIAYTPLREYIPGYGNVEERQMLFELSLKTDSLEKELQAREIYFNAFYSMLLNLDSAMLLDNYSAYSNSGDNPEFNTENKQASFLLPPLKGKIVNKFDASKEHYGIDISGEKDSFIHSVADGIVVFSDWTLDGGKTIVIQHSSNIISVYKHNSVLIKQEGESVSAGEPVAVIGNTGEETNGPHLHFELWIDQVAVNPANHLSLE
jgi:murein DD-endopeptidase MepM/ murein hydrolase activator NlpD